MDRYLAWRALGAVAPSLPLDWGHAVARRLADLGYRRNVQAVRGLRANISHAMGASAPAARVDGAVRQAYRTLLSNYFDLFRLPALSAEQLRALIPVSGWEVVKLAPDSITQLQVEVGSLEAHGIQVSGMAAPL